MELEIRGRIKERSERKGIVALTVSAAGVVTVRADAVAVRMPESMGNGAAERSMLVAILCAERQRSRPDLGAVTSLARVHPPLVVGW